MIDCCAGARLRPQKSSAAPASHRNGVLWRDRRNIIRRTYGDRKRHITLAEESLPARDADATIIAAPQRWPCADVIMSLPQDHVASRRHHGIHKRTRTALKQQVKVAFLVYLRLGPAERNHLAHGQEFK